MFPSLVLSTDYADSLVARIWYVYLSDIYVLLRTDPGTAKFMYHNTHIKTRAVGGRCEDCLYELCCLHLVQVFFCRCAWAGREILPIRDQTDRLFLLPLGMLLLQDLKIKIDTDDADDDLQVVSNSYFRAAVSRVTSIGLAPSSPNLVSHDVCSP